MKIEQIEQIIEVAKTGSQNKAAKNLYISQPNLSMSIKNLESELNIQIFVRTKQGMELTPEGKQFLYYAEPVYQQFLTMPELFSNIVQKQKFIFSISNAYMKFVSNVVADTVEHFSKEPFFIKYLENTSDEIIEHVSSQVTDIGVLYFSSIQRNRMLKLFDYNNLVYTKLMDDELKIIFGKKNPLYKQKLRYVTSENLHIYPIIVYETTHSSEIMETIQLKLSNNSRTIIVNSRGSKIDLLRNTNAIAFGTSSIIPYKYTDFYPDLKTLPVKRIPFSMEVGWVRRRDTALNKVSEFFINRLTDITTDK